MKIRILLVLMVLLPVLVASCRRDQKGPSSLSVQTTLPEGIEVTLVNVERPGTYVDRVRTDVGGNLNFFGIRPGRYKMIFQFTAPDPVPTNPIYNYGESEPFEVLAGPNRMEWTAGSNEVTRID